MNIKKLDSERGFTIVELLIALSVLSIILVISTVVITQIGRIYAKGVNTAELQNANRTIMSDINTSLRFSGSRPDACNATVTPLTCYASTQTFSGVTAYAYCIGATRYSYVLNREMGFDQASNLTTNHVLWRDTMATLGTCQPVDMSVSGKPSANGYEMVGQHMRLTSFKTIASTADPGAYATDVWMAYGDSDLVQADAIGTPTCSNGDGTEFCAEAQLSESIIRRLD